MNRLILPLIILTLIGLSYAVQTPTYNPAEEVSSALAQFNAQSNEEEFDESEACDSALAVKLNIQGACLALGYTNTPI